MRPRHGIVAGGIVPADVVTLEFGEREFLDERRRLLYPRAVQPTDLGLELEVVEHDDFAILRQLHVELCAVTAARHRIAKGDQRVLRIKSGAAAVSEIQGRHILSVQYARHSECHPRPSEARGRGPRKSETRRQKAGTLFWPWVPFPRRCAARR